MLPFIHTAQCVTSITSHKKKLTFETNAEHQARSYQNAFAICRNVQVCRYFIFQNFLIVTIYKFVKILQEHTR
jgi:hypothetical protein